MKRPDTFPIAQEAERRITLRTQSQKLVLLGYHKPSITHPDDAVYDAITSLLSEGRSSRLHESLVTKKKVAVQAAGFSGFPGQKYPGLFLFYAFTAPGKDNSEVEKEMMVEVERLIARASSQRAEIVCFPEAYLPGLRGQDFDVPPYDIRAQERALEAVRECARTYAIATIAGMERITDEGRQIVAVVIDASGEVQGEQTKNQLDPTEDRFYVPGRTRRIFEVNGMKFGVAICHEGWRYPETVRWAAARGAKIVFHPQLTGYEQRGVRLTEWGSAEAPYYEKAMMLRSIENTIFFASVNYAVRFQEAATTLIDPSGRCQAFLPYGEEGVLVAEIDDTKATGLLATRFAPERYLEGRPD